MLNVADGGGVSPEDLETLKEAVVLLEQSSFLVDLSSKLGEGVEFALNKLPDAVRKKVVEGTQAALQKALDLVLETLEPPQQLTAILVLAPLARLLPSARGLCEALAESEAIHRA